MKLWLNKIESDNKTKSFRDSNKKIDQLWKNPLNSLNSQTKQKYFASSIKRIGHWVNTMFIEPKSRASLVDATTEIVPLVCIRRLVFHKFCNSLEMTQSLSVFKFNILLTCWQKTNIIWVKKKTTWQWRMFLEVWVSGIEWLNKISEQLIELV